MTLNSLDKYGSNFQTKVISCLLTSRDFLIEVYELITSDFFNSQAHKWIIEEILRYFNKYHTTISIEILKIELEKIENEVLRENVKEKLIEAFEVSESDLRYVKDEFSSFCKNQKLKQAIEQSIDYLKVGDFNNVWSLVRDAVKSSEVRNVGHDYKKDTETRYRDEERNPIPFPWPQFNEVTQGGYGAGDLVLIFGNPGGAKSWTLVSMVAHAAKLGKKIVYYTLELGDSYVGRRLDANISKIPMEDLKANREKIEQLMNELPGQIIIKEYPPKKASFDTIERHLSQLKHQENFEPDAIFIDYLDYVKNKTKRKEKKEDIDDVYVGAKGLAKELRIPIVSPSQVNRMGAKDDIIEGDKAAGSYDKTMIADISISLSRKKEDKLKKIGRFFFMKNRYGPDGMSFLARVDTSTGDIEMLNEISFDDVESNAKISNNYNGIDDDDKKLGLDKFDKFFKVEKVET